MGKKVVWTNHALVELNQAFIDLLKKSQSLETTVRIINEIHESASILATKPEIYKLDGLKVKNGGMVRAYEKHTYRISYQIEEDEVYIIRVRYARKEPLEY